MIRVMFKCATSAAVARLAACLTRSVSHVSSELECFWLGEPSVDPLGIHDQLEIDPLDLDAATPITLLQAYSQQHDVIVTLGQREPHGWLSYPGMPICLTWDEGIDPERGPLTRESFKELKQRIQLRATRLVQDGLLESVSTLRSGYASLVNNLSDGVLAHDKQRRILIFNTAAEQITGYSASEVMGRDCHDVFPGFFCGGDCSFCSGNQSAGTRHRYPNRLIKKDGEVRDLEMSVLTFTVRSETFGAMVIFRDVTELNVLHRNVHREDRFQGIVGRHPTMKKVFDTIEELSGVDISILIQGESGTGKEMVAEALHRLSARSEKPFVPVNCGALPEGTLESELFGHVRGAFTGAIRDKKGRFELSDGGTLFLDEIGEISPALQVKLLRVLQEKSFIPVGGEKVVKVDVRIICATNRDLKELIRAGLFREDLYYRIAVVPVNLPSLRERKSDIPLLMQHFVERNAEVMGRSRVQFGDEAMEAFLSYNWPGNVRELSNAVQYALIKCHDGIVALTHLPRELRNQFEGKEEEPALGGNGISLEQILHAIEESQGNRSEAARLLGISRMTLYRHLRKTEQ